jgi:hypothetical protein
MEDEKSFDLRDRLAIEILNGVLSNEGSKDRVSDIIDFLGGDTNQTGWGQGAIKRVEILIRNCYKVADIIRKVRLSTFE